MEWSQAIDSCKAHGSCLPEIQTETENADTKNFGTLDGNIWLGATDTETEGIWIWISSKKSSQLFKLVGRTARQLEGTRKLSPNELLD